MEFFIVPRAVGKTTYLIDRVYREPGHQIVTAWAKEADRLYDLLVERCMLDGPPDWWQVPEHWPSDLRTLPQAQQRKMYRMVWEQKDAVQIAAQFKRGGPRKVLIDNVDHVLAALFGDVEEVTATANLSTRLPTVPRTRCRSCGNPYDPDTDAFGLCIQCLSDDTWFEDE